MVLTEVKSKLGVYGVICSLSTNELNVTDVRSLDNDRFEYSKYNDMLGFMRYIDVIDNEIHSEDVLTIAISNDNDKLLLSIIYKYDDYSSVIIFKDYTTNTELVIRLSEHPITLADWLPVKGLIDNLEHIVESEVVSIIRYGLRKLSRLRDTNVSSENIIVED